jgi:hypothetical protein
MRQLDIPLSIYAATQADEYRKPRTGMWKELMDDYDLDLDERLDLKGSFFVGDAAGRPADHSCSDRLDALSSFFLELGKMLTLWSQRLCIERRPRLQNPRRVLPRRKAGASDTKV